MDAVAERTHLFNRKLEHLVKRWPGTQRQLAERVGVTQQMLNNYLRGSLPKPVTIYKLARELGAPLDWLLDDEAEGLDPAEREGVGTAAKLTDDELMFEYAKRLRRKAVQFYRCLERALHLKWELAAVSIYTDHKLVWEDKKAKDYVLSVTELYLLAQEVDALDADLFTERHHHELPGNELEPGKLKPLELRLKWEALREKHPGIKAIYDYTLAIALMKTGRPLDNETWQRYGLGTVAELVSSEPLASEPAYDDLRKQLREKGYLDAQNKPVQFKTEQGWDTRRMSMAQIIQSRGLWADLMRSDAASTAPEALSIEKKKGKGKR